MKPESEAIISKIIELVHQLSAQERRILQRRLRVSGVIEIEEPVSDRNRLDVATALGTASAKRLLSSDTASVAASGKNKLVVPEHPNNSPSPSPAKPDANFLAQEAAALVAPAKRKESKPNNHSEESSTYQSAVSGKVVVGAPGDAAENLTVDPHLMSPLPGLAPEQPIRVVFDGGSKGNPGVGYGSYALDWPGLPRQIVQLQFGNQVTNNEAEYDTLIAALEGLVARLEDQNADVSTAQLDIRGDSELVIKQVRGEYKCKNDRMRVRRDRVVELLDEFEDWSLVHHGRENSVRILGH